MDYVTVTFNSNGGSSISSQTVVKSKKAVEPKVPVKNGYKFRKWYIDSACVTEFDFNQSLTTNITLYAGWDVYKAITYHANGISNQDIVQPLETGKTQYILPKNIFIRGGWDLTKWNTKSDGTGTNIAFDSQVTFTNSADLYAIWKFNSDLLPQSTNWQSSYTVPATTFQYCDMPGKITFVVTNPQTAASLTYTVYRKLSGGAEEQLASRFADEASFNISISDNMVGYSLIVKCSTYMYSHQITGLKYTPN